MLRKDHQNFLGYIKSSIHSKYDVPLEQIKLNRTTKCVSINGQIVVRTRERTEHSNTTNVMTSKRKSKTARKNCQKTCSNDCEQSECGDQPQNKGTTTRCQGEEMAHGNQKHKDFEVKGGGRQRLRLRHFDGNFLSCMRKTKKSQNPEDDLRVWMKGDE